MQNSMKTIIFVPLVYVMTFVCSVFCYANVIIENCEFGTYCISDTLYQVRVPEYAPTANTRIYCTEDEVNKDEPENNITIISGTTAYGTSMEDIEKYAESLVKGMIYKNRMFNIVIDKYDTNIGNTKNGDILITITTISENGLFEALHEIITNYKFTIVSERCIDFSKKAELDANVQLILDTYVFK